MRTLAILFLLTVIASCTKDSPRQDQPAEDLKSRGAWPILKGNYWVYRDSVFSEFGFVGVNVSDTVNTTDSITYEGRSFYGRDRLFPDSYYRQVNDSTTEIYSVFLKNARVYFKQVNANNTIISKKEEDVKNYYVDGEYRDYHIVTTHTGFTETTNINGYDCVRNEYEIKYSDKLADKLILYVKPGIGLIRSVHYVMNQRPGEVFLATRRDLVSYRLK